MSLFKKKPDSMSLTFALVQAHVSDDQNLIDQAREGLSPIPTMEILESLYRFGQILNGANLSTDQTRTIEVELATTTGSSEITEAVEHIGRAILVERTQAALFEALNTYGPPLANSTSDQLRQVALILTAITGSICNRLNVKFNWK